MKSNKFLSGIICFISLIGFQPIHIYAQKQVSFDPEISSSYLRTGDILYEFRNFRSTRFLPIISISGMDDFTSPSSFFLIDGTGFNLFPLNHKTVDLVPVDLLNIEKINIRKNVAANDYYKENIRINSKAIPDSTKLSFRAFTGSETGDPLVHTFTRSDLNISNVNKIVPSFVLSYSDKIRHIKYRLTGGYFGFFSTGSFNDPVIENLNPYFFGRQNKQFISSGEAEYVSPAGSQIKLSGSFLSYYGWDVTPFITTFAHFESYSYRTRLQYINHKKDFSISVSKDGLITETHPAYGMDPLKYSIDEHSMHLDYKPLHDDFITTNISQRISLTTAQNLLPSNNLTPQHYFNNDIKRTTFYTMVGTSINLLNDLNSDIYLQYEYGLNKQSGLSGGVEVSYIAADKHSFIIDLNTQTKYPSIDELFGNFGFRRQPDMNSAIKEFHISGSSNLSYERSNEASLSYLLQDENRYLRVKLFFLLRDNMITQSSDEVIRSYFPGDVIRNSQYINNVQKKFYGMNISFSNKLFDLLLLKAYYKFTDNRELLSVPKHHAVITSTLSLPFFARISAVYLHQSKTFWSEYSLTLPSVGIDHLPGHLSGFGSFSLSYEQELRNLFFIDEIIIRLAVENVFDKNIIVIPAGNRLDRTITLSVSGRIF